MDEALVLKQKTEAGEVKSFTEASDFLKKSRLVAELLTDFDINSLNLLHRLTELAEIPFTHELEKARIWVEMLANSTSCESGFSLTGKNDGILSCYNSMITGVLINMKYSNVTQIENGINWIINYQHVERGKANTWPGKAVLKYGGCMKKTPCYIGIVKAMAALTAYKLTFKNAVEPEIKEKLVHGLEYILEHEVFKKQTDGKPVTHDILKLTYPFSYKTNIIEILRLLRENDVIDDPRCGAAKSFLLSKKTKQGYWKTNSTRLPKHWVRFDKPGEAGAWITHEINKIVHVN